MAESMNLLKLPGYNDFPQIKLDRIFKVVILPMLKELIKERVRPSVLGGIDTIIKQHHHQDIFPINDRPKFKFDEIKDFRFALKIVSYNKIDCFPEKEVKLCGKLLKLGNRFVHTSEVSSEFVSEVLALTKNLLSTISIKIDTTNYNQLLELLVENK